MKRYIAAGMAALMLTGFLVPAYAADAAETDKTEEQKGPVTLSFETLEETVRANNVSIKAGQSTLTGVEKTDPGDSYITNYWNTDNEIAQYTKQIKELDEAIAALSDDESALRDTLKAQRYALQKSLEAAQASYDDLEDKEDDDEEQHEFTVNSTRRQTENAADLICMGAESTYISLQSLAFSHSERERSLKQLERNIEATRVRVSLGAAGQNTLKSLQSQRETVLAALDTIETQVENLKNTLAVQCGYAIGTELITTALPEVAPEQAGGVDYAADLAEALKNSYSIWSKEDAVRQASDDYENNKTNNLYAYKAAQIELDAEKEKATVAFRKLYKALEEARTMLGAAQSDWEQAQKTFHVQETQYKRGMISKLDYLNAQDELETAREAIDSAKIDLLTAYNNYQWAKRGVISSAS